MEVLIHSRRMQVQGLDLLLDRDRVDDRGLGLGPVHVRIGTMMKWNMPT